MNSWKRFNETSLPELKEFYSNVNVEKIANAKRVWNDFKIKTSW